jgi:hypothetical protein
MGNIINIVKGYKGFDEDLKCRNLQYEIGHTYKEEGPIRICRNGFHFCKKVISINEFYKLKSSRICEVEALGRVIEKNGKSVTGKIKIIRELSEKEIRDSTNAGTNNTGYGNSGFGNSGNLNSGDRNSGHLNSGSGNSGHENSGDLNSGNFNNGNWNSGSYNSGYVNSGEGNSGKFNSGDWNSGSFNSCDKSAGVFMSRRISWEAFNKSLTANEFRALTRSAGYKVCEKFRLVKFRVRAETGKFGDFQYLDYKASWQVFWNSLSLRQRMDVRRMPFLDKDVFLEITGVKL